MPYFWEEVSKKVEMEMDCDIGGEGGDRYWWECAACGWNTVCHSILNGNRACTLPGCDTHITIITAQKYLSNINHNKQAKKNHKDLAMIQCTNIDILNPRYPFISHFKTREKNCTHTQST